MIALFEPKFNTLYEALDSYLMVYCKPIVKRKTLYGYERAAVIIKEYLPNLPVTDYNEAQLQLFLNVLSVEKNYSKSSIDKILIILRAAFRCAYRNLHITYDTPASSLRLPAAKQKKILGYTLEEEAIIRKACVYDIYGDFILFDLNTGLRRSELERLQKTDIDWEQGLIHITQSKTESGIRAIPMQDESKKILLNQFARYPHSPYVFVSRTEGTMTECVIRRLSERMRRETGISDFNLHRCRHTFATRLLENGLKNYAALAKLMGHSDVAFTMRQYVHPDKAELCKAISLLHGT